MDNITEKQNSKSENLNQLEVIDILDLINKEDRKIAQSVSSIMPKISYLIIDIISKMKENGRLFYVGCGTSGRLGVLDASECPPTFGVPDDMVQGIIAGGYKALSKSVEDAEDSYEDGYKIISERKIIESDIIIGISASGSASYVHGALNSAKKNGCTTALICCNKIKNESYIDHLLSIVVGPEIITGSTRMKAGTATKMVLNMISTTVMVKLNKVYGNLMIDLKLNNKKLVKRAISIIMNIASVNQKTAESFLKKAGGNLRIAIIMIKYKKTFNQSEKMLDKFNFDLEKK